MMATTNLEEDEEAVENEPSSVNLLERSDNGRIFRVFQLILPLPLERKT